MQVLEPNFTPEFYTMIDEESVRPLQEANVTQCIIFLLSGAFNGTLLPNWPNFGYLAYEKVIFGLNRGAPALTEKGRLSGAS